MGLIRGLLSLPLNGPAHGTMWLARKIEEAASAEFHDPAAIRRALNDLEIELEAGRISEDDFDIAEEELMRRLEGKATAE